MNESSVAPVAETSVAGDPMPVIEILIEGLQLLILSLHHRCQPLFFLLQLLLFQRALHRQQ